MAVKGNLTRLPTTELAKGVKEVKRLKEYEASVRAQAKDLDVSLSSQAKGFDSGLAAKAKKADEALRG